ncbi:RluA family pseudouridine synthase [Candidatus Mycoplasma haematominutum]|uniref:RNA pseudouridylate synthase n=1 Tax=Candidatus Mycoplasma haematominutum 'Birmingham 1' TaxID=1116213 RepID=G8C2M8_9MOLU|nr:RluA family pseudouridine synthase [Candidatus Mycoplasma haematominutum]CCE66576.1 ribosomal large subunit pseudouridine synthase D [Candidatus Mycoplasma haematominutum 'Birmingham 1']
MEVDIVYETPYYLIVNKSSGILVHKDRFTYEKDTVIGALREKYGEKLFLVNRLDRDTSGLFLVAKSKMALLTLKALFDERKIEKKYLAILSSPLPHPKVKISFSLGRDKGDKLKISATNSRKFKPALTYAETIDSKLVLLSLKTGRTHQLRAHLFTMSCAILNDPIYGVPLEGDLFGQYLHSFSVLFIDPWTAKPVIVWTMPPLEFSKKLTELKIDVRQVMSFVPNAWS